MKLRNILAILILGTSFWYSIMLRIIILVFKTFFLNDMFGEHSNFIFVGLYLLYCFCISALVLWLINYMNILKTIVFGIIVSSIILLYSRIFIDRVEQSQWDLFLVLHYWIGCFIAMPLVLKIKGMRNIS